MPKSRQRKASGSGEVLRPLIEFDKITSILKVHERQWRHEMDDAEIKRWMQDLQPYKIEAIEWAFESWRLGGRFFPVPHDILSMLETWTPADTIVSSSSCNAECRRNHGKGYGENDIRWMWNRIVGSTMSTHFSNGNPRGNIALAQARALAGDASQTVVVRNQTIVETIAYDELLEQLDAARSGPPEWRKQRTL
jgi:hypothetical protein